MLDPGSLDPAAAAGLLGALLGALVGGVIGLIGVSSGARSAREQERLAVRRSAYVAFLADVQRYHSVGLRIDDFENRMAKVRSKAEEISERSQTNRDLPRALEDVKEAEALALQAEQVGVKVEEFRPLLDSFQHSRLQLWLVAPRLIRQQAEAVMNAAGTQEYDKRLADFLIAARLDTEADEDKVQHRILRAYLKRRG